MGRVTGDMITVAAEVTTDEMARVAQREDKAGSGQVACLLGRPDGVRAMDRGRSEGEDVAGSSIVVAGEVGDVAVQRVDGRVIGWVGRGNGVAVRLCGRYSGGRGRKRGGKEGAAHWWVVVFVLC